MLLAVTAGRGLTPVTAQSTHIYNVIVHISGGTIIIVHISPHMRGYMVPWTIRGIPELSSNAELREMQQDAHKLMQLIGTPTPNIPHQTPVPQVAENLLDASPVKPMDIIIALLAVAEVLAAYEGRDYMQSSLIGPIMPPNLIVKEFATCAGRAVPIPYQYISRSSRGQWADPDYITKEINGHGNFIHV